MSNKTPAPGHVDHPLGRLGHPQNFCFGCGVDNPEGMKLQFFFDEAAHLAICHFTLEGRYQGPPRHAHGGIIATILDEAMGKVNKLRNVIGLTRNMEIKYLKPVPLGKPLTVTAREQHISGREHTNAADITNEQGQILAQGTATFVQVDPERMFRKLNPEGGQT
ncbi:MAG TPA: PaaI family thioesterase [Candidatus Saccharimonadales bacterium]|jgi:uncharacterized protein (TIGR00369 family)|nr:PaaI family thioesterase [Candidatus Saccharimonadales bacterium]